MEKLRTDNEENNRRIEELHQRDAEKDRRIEELLRKLEAARLGPAQGHLEPMAKTLAAGAAQGAATSPAAAQQPRPPELAAERVADASASADAT